MTDCNSQQNTPLEGIDPDEFRKKVAELAYCKAEKRGFIPGYETEDWLEAEQELISQGGCLPQPAE